MTLLAARPGPPPWLVAAYEIGKEAADREVAYNLVGTLYLSPTGYILLSVPSALIRGVFSAMKEPGIELPPVGPSGRLDGHVTVLSPGEIEMIGGADKVTERGKQFAYTLGRLYAFEPDGWPGVETAWALDVHSPALQELRRSLGLSGLPRGGEGRFHLTIGLRRKKVLGRNVVARGVAGVDDIE